MRHFVKSIRQSCCCQPLPHAVLRQRRAQPEGSPDGCGDFATLDTWAPRWSLAALWNFLNISNLKDNGSLVNFHRCCILQVFLQYPDTDILRRFRTEGTRELCLIIVDSWRCPLVSLITLTDICYSDLDVPLSHKNFALSLLQSSYQIRFVHSRWAASWSRQILIPRFSRHVFGNPLHDKVDQSSVISNWLFCLRLSVCLFCLLSLSSDWSGWSHDFIQWCGSTRYASCEAVRECGFVTVTTRFACEHSSIIDVDIIIATRMLIHDTWICGWARGWILIGRLHVKLCPCITYVATSIRGHQHYLPLR